MLSKRSVINVSGKDSKEFLQGLITNDINLLQDDGKFLHCLMLTPQGKFLHEFYIIRSGEAYIINIWADKAEELTKRLNMYKLRSEVVISTPLTSSIIPELYDHRTVPTGYFDLIQDKSFPLEFGMEYLNCISFTKGCYVGQELTARTKHRGVVRKKCYIIESHPGLATIIYGAELTQNGKVIGSFCSFDGQYGKALVREEDYTPTEHNAILQGVNISLKQGWWYPSL